MSNMDHTKYPGVNSGVREGLEVPASYQTPIVLLTCTVNSGLFLCSDGGKKNVRTM